MNLTTNVKYVRERYRRDARGRNVGSEFLVYEKIRGRPWTDRHIATFDAIKEALNYIEETHITTLTDDERTALEGQAHLRGLAPTMLTLLERISLYSSLVENEISQSLAADIRNLLKKARA